MRLGHQWKQVVERMSSGRACRVISIPPGPPTFVDTFGPPMEAGGRADEIRPLLKRGAVRELGIFEVLTAGEVLVDQPRVGQRPQVLRRVAIGRGPGGAHSRGSGGFKPIRCSSVAHSSTWAWGNAVATACSSGLIFF